MSVRAISDDGRVVAATNTGLPSDRFTFIWDPIHGSRRLEDILAAHGVDLTGWRELFAFDMSADGRVIVGQGNGDVFPGQGFRAVIPPLCLADCDGSGSIDAADLLCFLARFERAGDPVANPVDFLYADLTNDSAIDFNDFLEFLNLYNRGACP